MKIPRIFYQQNRKVQEELQELILDYEQKLLRVTAKDIKTVQKLSGKGREVGICLSVLYLVSNVDPNVGLGTDKRTLSDSSWQYFQQYAKNCGNVVYQLKRVRDLIDQNEISNSHLSMMIYHLQQAYEAPQQ